MASVASIPEVISLAKAAPPSERLPALDLARGIAILMILPINMALFSGVADPMGGGRRMEASWLDHAVRAFILFFVEAKFITLLSILFGAGLALQMSRVEGGSFTTYYLRRMGILFAIGLAHALFLWFGDILTSYAIVAVGALYISKLPARAQLAIVAACLLWFLLSSLGIAGALAFAGIPTNAAPAAISAPTPSGRVLDPVEKWIETYFTAENQARIYRDGAAWELVLARAFYLLGYVVFTFWPLVVWYLLACFVIGMWLVRYGIFRDFADHRQQVIWGILLCLAIGLPVQLLALIVYTFRPDGVLAGFVALIGALPMSLAYLGLILFWSQHGGAGWLQTSLQAVGRTALSNYLLQSLMGNIVFYSYGLRLYGRVSEATAFGIVVLIWLVEIALSMLWLRFFQIGPVEWAWRSLADGKTRPLLRASNGPLAA
jgi:uncharacterized protein